MKEEKPIAKIGTREEAFWTEIKESTFRDIERLEKLLKFQKEILKMAENKILEAGK